jgi:hypothetical protein
VIVAIAAHFCIGVGGTVCGTCGRKFCCCRRNIIIATISFLLIEATTSVLVIDHLLKGT